MNQIEESRRREQRRLFNAEAAVQVMESFDREILGLRMHADIVDVSTRGLRLSCERFINECSVGVWVDLVDSSDTFFLTADVKWASWHEGDGYQLGLEFVDNPLSDIEKWNDLWRARLDLV